MKEIKLTQGFVALVDDEDFERMSKIKWCIFRNRNKIYAINGSPRIYMHKLLLPAVKMVDHRDGNGLNNQKGNLREVNHSQNGANRIVKKGKRSEYLGVYMVRDKWRVASRKDKVLHVLPGLFTSELEAALAYNNLAKKLHGEFANLNFIDI